MRLDREENPKEGTRNYRFDPGRNFLEGTGELRFDEEVEGLIEDRGGLGAPIPEPLMIPVHFGDDDHQPEESVHFDVLFKLFPGIMYSVIANIRISFPAVPDAVKCTLISFLYTGVLKDPGVNHNSDYKDICEAFELMFHLNMAGGVAHISRLKFPSRRYLWKISELMTEQQVRDIVANKIQTEYPRRAPEWLVRWIDRIILKRYHNLLQGFSASTSTHTGEQDRPSGTMRNDE